jgi:hypothetical protein
MSKIGTNRRPTDRKPFIMIAVAVLAVVIIAAFLWTPHEREAARNDRRMGTTTEMSPKDPTPAPGGGAQRNSVSEPRQ